MAYTRELDEGASLPARSNDTAEVVLSTGSELREIALLVSGVRSMGSRQFARGSQRWRCLRCCANMYVVLFGLSSIAWMGVHCYFVAAQNNTNMTPEPEKEHYHWLYGISFCLPSVDGVMNLLFAVLHVRWQSKRDRISMGQFTFMKQDRHLWLVLFITVFVVLVRFLWIVIAGIGSLRGVLAVGSVIEFLPHIAPFLLLYAETARMSTMMSYFHDHIINDVIAPGRCVAVYSDFGEEVRLHSSRWQVFIVLSVALEAYTIVFQSLWTFWNKEPSEPHNAIESGFTASLLTLIEGCYMAFKLWPVVCFNRRVRRFANILLVETAAKQDTLQNPDQKERLEQAVTSTSMLFMSRPPYLKLCTIVVDTTTLVTVFVSVTFTSVSKYIFAAAQCI